MPVPTKLSRLEIYNKELSSINSHNSINPLIAWPYESTLNKEYIA